MLWYKKNHGAGDFILNSKVLLTYTLIYLTNNIHMNKKPNIDLRKANNLYHKFTSTNNSQTRSWYTIAKETNENFWLLSMYILKEKCIFWLLVCLRFFDQIDNFCNMCVISVPLWYSIYIVSVCLARCYTNKDNEKFV